MMRIYGHLRDEQGELVVSFSIIMPLLAAVMGLLITIFALMYTNIIVVDATRDGARHRALNLDSTTGVPTEDVIRNDIGFARLPSAGSIVSVAIDDSTNYVTVTTQYYQDSLIPKLPQLFGGNAYPNKFTIQAKTAFKKEKS